MSAEQPHVPGTKRRLQFSLGALLASVIALGAALGLWFADRENVRLQGVVKALNVENKGLRNELGYLEIDDPKKICVRLVNPYIGFKRRQTPEEWSFHIHVPEGSYRIGYQRDEVGTDAIDRSHSQYLNLGTVEGKIDLKIAHFVDTEKNTFELHFEAVTAKCSSGSGPRGGLKMKSGFGPNYQPTGSASLHAVDWLKTYTFEPKETVILIFLKCPLVTTTLVVSQTTTSAMSTSLPGPGLLVWLEQVPEQANDAAK
jgi:hypothetical protein